MENPLLSSDTPEESKPAEAPKAAETAPVAPAGPPAPEASKPEAPKEKKPFFTTGKILAIFGALIVIAAIVGAVIYSQTSERFQGMSRIQPVQTTVELQQIDTIRTVSPESLAVIPQFTCDEDKGLISYVGEDGSTSCVCPEGELYNTLTDVCEAVDFCDLTEAQIKRGSGNNFNHPDTRQDLRDIMSGIAEWKEANCGEPSVSITTDVTPLTVIVPDIATDIPDSRTTPEADDPCTTAINGFLEAYDSKNWDQMSNHLKIMMENNCVDNCRAKLYLVIVHLWQNELDQAKEVISQFRKDCSGCSNDFDMLALMAQVLADIDKVKQEEGSEMNAEYIPALEDLAEKYVTDCACVELEAFLNNPGFDISAILPEAADEPTASTRIPYSTLDLSNEATKLRTVAPAATTTFENPFTYLNEDVLTIAYAQSAGLSPSVISALEGVFNDKCVEPDPDPTPDPVNCTALEIVLPSGDDMEITEDFSSDSDLVTFNVTGTDNVENYNVFASNDSIIFNDLSSNEYTDNTEVTLSGGPDLDDPVTLTVQAVDVTGLRLDDCKDSIVISRAQPADDEPVCRALNIVAPADANQTGTAEFVIPAGGFVDEALTVEIDGDQGSWGNITYQTSTGNNDIVFDDENPLETDALTVLMNGLPVTNESETIEVFALDPETNQLIDSCMDSFTVTVDTDTPPSLTYTPPEDEEPPPSLTYTPPEDDEEPPSLAFDPGEEEEPPPSLAYTPDDDDDDDRRRSGGSSTRITVVEEEPEPEPIHAAAPEEPEIPASPAQPSDPTYVAEAQQALHAAPATPQTGPGLIIPLIGVSLAGAWMRRKKK